MKLPLRTIRLAALAGVLLAFAPGPANAALLTLEHDFEFSGGTAPAGTAPWITATFDDSIGGANTVRLTMSNHDLVGSENVVGWYFNFDPALDSSLLSFTAVDNADSVPNGIIQSLDCCKADGDGLYDFQFDFPPPPGSMAARFTAGETVIYDITYISAIDVNSFDFLSTPDGGAGVFTSAAHVQNTGGGGASGWVAPSGVPEPSAALLLAAGALGLVARRLAFRA